MVWSIPDSIKNFILTDFALKYQNNDYFYLLLVLDKDKQVSRLITIYKNDLHDCIKYLLLLWKVLSELPLVSPGHDEAHKHNFQPLFFWEKQL